MQRSLIKRLHSTAVVCASGSGVSFGLIQRLRSRWGEKVHIIGLDSNPAPLVTASVVVDEFYTVCQSNERVFLDQISDILDKHDGAHVYPALNSDFTALSEIRKLEKFRNCDFVCPVDDKIKFVKDKLALFEALSAINVPTPKLFTTKDIENGCCDDELFVKPRDGCGSKGARKVNKKELVTYDRKLLNSIIVQEVCQKPEVTVDVFIDIVRGDFAAVCRERVEIKAGVCTKARIFADKGLEKIAEQLCEFFGMSGGFCFQVMKIFGKWVVIDLNFRLGAGTALSCAIGADFFSAMHGSRCGECGIDYIDLSWIKQGDCYVTRQYTEYITRLPNENNGA